MTDWAVEGRGRVIGVRWWRTLWHAVGFPEHAVSWRERLVATVTAGLGIGTVAWLTNNWLGWGEPSAHSVWLMASIGASAVLVFGVPHGALAQPWAVVGGQGLSALAGVFVAHVLGDGVLAAGCAVALAVAVMHTCRCVHPPGGATALSAVLATTASGPPAWSYVLSPVLVSAALIVVIATVLNAPFRWRRYPVVLAFHHSAVAPGAQLGQEEPFTARQLREALDELDSMVAISDEELQALYQALRRRQEHDSLTAADLRVDGCYSNGQAGENWSVLQIVDALDPGARRAQFIVKAIAGRGRNEVRTMSQEDLLAWGKYEVVPDGSVWHRVEPSYPKRPRGSQRPRR